MVFIFQTAHQTAADTGNLRRIQGQALVLRHADRHRLEVTKEGCAAQRTTAAANTAEHLCLIAHANLTQLDTGAENGSKVLYQLTEINTAISSEVENNLVHIKRKLYINQAHRQLMIFNLAQADIERFLFADFVLCQLHIIGLCCLAHYRLQRRNNLLLLHLTRTDNNLAIFHAARSLDNSKVALLHAGFCRVKIIYLTCLFKTDTYNCRHNLTPYMLHLFSAPEPPAPL